MERGGSGRESRGKKEEEKGAREEGMNLTCEFCNFSSMPLELVVTVTSALCTEFRFVLSRDCSPCLVPPHHFPVLALGRKKGT